MTNYEKAKKAVAALKLTNVLYPSNASGHVIGIQNRNVKSGRDYDVVKIDSSMSIKAIKEKMTLKGWVK